MKITKFAHSCVLIETADRVGLFDPGIYSWNSGSFEIDKLDHLDDILITHEHTDHMHLPFIKALTAKFPDVTITTTESAAALLASQGITNAKHAARDGISLFQSAHESMEPLLPTPPQCIGIHYLESFSHPGDGHHFRESKSILALPITGRWGTTVRAAAIIKELRPAYVLPIHDWLWREEIRLKTYSEFGTFCENLGVTFLAIHDGLAIEIAQDAH
jgi:L-ascorbate metabolism protein UlaG (beta-lactamase superfamily)